MHISELRIMGFRSFGGESWSNEGNCFEKPVVISLESSITAFIGKNSAGKSACLLALQRLFGETRDVRNIRSDDFFVMPNEALDSISKRKLYIEVIINFPEDDNKQDGAKNTIPIFFNDFIIDRHGGIASVRIRLESTWEADLTLEGLIDENIYVISTFEDVPFGEHEEKHKLSPNARSNIIVKYLPASRDIQAMTRLALDSFGKSIMKSIKWENKDEIEKLTTEIIDKTNAEKAMLKINEAINNCWKDLNAADTETESQLSILPFEFQQILKTATVLFEPTAIGRKLELKDLSDGQRSLFHFVLVKSLLSLRLSLENDTSEDNNNAFDTTYIKAPALTIFAFEEPENHLAPYFLSRLISELQELVQTCRVQGIITSHSPSIVGRLDPTALRYFRKIFENGTTCVHKLILPHDDDEAAKFIREAVRAHPEIYFARHIIFGEGASEEIVLPRLAEAIGVSIDKSFIAMVPIGGRHIKHFWNLASQIGVPYTTLLDFDLGRSSGDTAQLQVVMQAIKDFNPQKYIEGKKDIDNMIHMSLERNWDDDKECWNTANFQTWTDWLEGYGVFFSFPLDLDLIMYEAYPEAYQKLPKGRRGPNDITSGEGKQKACETILGEQSKDSFGILPYKEHCNSDVFVWYKYLFMGSRGKPAVHMWALSHLTNDELKKSCPKIFERLIKYVENSLA